MCGWLVGWMGVQLVRRSNGSYAKMAHEVTASCGVTKSFGFGQAGNSFELPSCVCLMRILWVSKASFGAGKWAGAGAGAGVRKMPEKNTWWEWCGVVTADRGFKVQMGVLKFVAFAPGGRFSAANCTLLPKRLTFGQMPPQLLDSAASSHDPSILTWH